jgi:cytidylate kinase
MRVVTIDGPAGAGKSTVSRRLADRLGWRLLDTGAMYRALTVAALRAGLDLESDEALGALAARVSVTLPRGRVLLDGEDVTAEVRGAEVSRASRYIADSPSVRRRLVELQREFAGENDVIAEGRDQGTVVFPDALRKFYLTASLEERARRRHAEHVARGESLTEKTVLDDLRLRDDLDAARAIAPMKPAPDATVIDTTGLSLDEVVARIERDVLERLGATAEGVRGSLVTQDQATTTAEGATAAEHSTGQPAHDRPWLARVWYESVRLCAGVLFVATGGLRVTGKHLMPPSGGALLVSNHMSYLDVFVLGLSQPRPLNYVARSTLFVPVLASLIRSVGGFPIQREGVGASGFREILRRVRAGGIVLLFPEGTRSPDGRLGEIRSGIALLASKARVPVVPAALAGTFEAWPRGRSLPWPHPIRVVYGPPILPADLAGLPSQAITALITDRIVACRRAAFLALARDLELEPPGICPPRSRRR